MQSQHIDNASLQGICSDESSKGIQMSDVANARNQMHRLSRRLDENCRLPTRIHLLILVLASAVSLPAIGASCSTPGGGNYNLPVGARTIGRDVIPGTQAIPKVGGQPSVGYQVSCPGDSTADREAYITFSVQSTPVSGYVDVYPTNIDGLGAKYHFATNSGDGCNIPFDQTIPNSAYTITCQIPRGTTHTWSWGTSVEFIKTGPIAPGPLTSVPAVTMSYALNNQAGSWPLTTMYSGAMTGSVYIASCTTPDIAVDLGTHQSTSFVGIGTKVGTKDFAIAVNSCPPGMNTVKYQLDPAPEISIVNATQAVVGLGSGSTVTGVGVQITDRSNVPMTYGTMRATTGYSKTTGGSFSIPLRASYYQTAAAVNGGPANSAVVFTMSYE
ncbi:major type 1 subunit fimbrin (pilin) [Lysobacter niastensis]|uniref:Major type 1 subunit fimbrin (Pilin) n=1 Tax=Lysobacter niastensis TaxID=380629 RepID=A0ABU1WBJ5_9GAMM|nr:fimbrial protein [Lysobacter niastensis]MDR7135011.1 major type 1 subunit fimbrin (pilin) [Lysobacter niastensis]